MHYPTTLGRATPASRRPGGTRWRSFPKRGSGSAGQWPRRSPTFRPRPCDETVIGLLGAPTCLPREGRNGLDAAGKDGRFAGLLGTPSAKSCWAITVHGLRDYEAVAVGYQLQTVDLEQPVASKGRGAARRWLSASICGHVTTAQGCAWYESVDQGVPCARGRSNATGSDMVLSDYDIEVRVAFAGFRGVV